MMMVSCHPRPMPKAEEKAGGALCARARNSPLARL